MMMTAVFLPQHPVAVEWDFMPVSRAASSPWIVYILRCGDGTLYTGITNDLDRRLRAHAAGKASRYTRSRLPVRTAYEERQPSKSAALKREAAIKRLPRAAKDRLLASRRAGS